MQIKIEIDVKPEELRRFLGLPDVAGLQDDVVRFLREKVSAAGDTIDPAALLQGSFDIIKKTSAWKMMRGVVLGTDHEAMLEAEEAAATAPPAPEPTRRRRTAKAAGKIARKVVARKRSRKAAATE